MVNQKLLDSINLSSNSEFINNIDFKYKLNSSLLPTLSARISFVYNHNIDTINKLFKPKSNEFILFVTNGNTFIDCYLYKTILNSSNMKEHKIFYKISYYEKYKKINREFNIDSILN